jgi:hypothetical protein
MGPSDCVPSTTTFDGLHDRGVVRERQAWAMCCGWVSAGSILGVAGCLLQAVRRQAASNGRGTLLLKVATWHPAHSDQRRRYP